MTQDVRDQVVAAFEANDQLAIRRLGFWPAWEAAATWWSPRQGCTAKEFVPYAKLLGDEDPAAVLEAFRELAGDWRPHPAAIRGYLHRAKDDEPRTNIARSRDPAATDAAIRAVADALRAGERPCTCPGRAATWAIDALGVLRCRAAERGLELGQVYAAEDLGLIDEKAAA